MDDFGSDVVDLFIQLLELGEGLLVAAEQLADVILELLLFIRHLVEGECVSA